ncbi:aquIMA [Symbiodinium sp. CCMP2592]|nr:aquIMA [Symbiodinium sp. CCMP2592]
MALGDPSLRELSLGQLVDIVVVHIHGDTFKGLWNCDLFACKGLGPGVWTLYGFVLDHIDQNTGHLRATDTSKAFLRPEASPDSVTTLVEVCSGIGGISVGAHFAGFNTLLSVDKSEIACATVRLNGGAAIAGDVGDRAVQLQISMACCNQGHILAAGFPCNSYSVQGSGKGISDPRGQVLLHVLQIAWRNQSHGLLLECVSEVCGYPEVEQLLQRLAAAMHLQLQQVRLDLADQWASRRARWWCVMLPAGTPDLTLPVWPTLPVKLVVQDVIAEWPIWPSDQVQKLAWTPQEVEKYMDPAYGSDCRCLDVRAQAPTALHSWGSALHACPCGCRANAFTEHNLRVNGLRGVGVATAGLSGLRFPHASEVGFLNTLPASFLHLSEPRAALCLVGQIAAPLQALWVSAHIRMWIELAFDLPNVTCPMQLLEDFKSMLHESQRDFWTTSAIAASSSVWLSVDGSPFELPVSGPTTVAQLVKAEKALQGSGVTIQVFEGDRRLPAGAFLHPNGAASPYRLVLRRKTACRTAPALPQEPQQPEGTSDVTIWTGLLRLQAASSKPAFVAPPALVTGWLRLTWLRTGHWALLAISREHDAGPAVTLFDGLPGRSTTAAQALADAICLACDMPQTIVSEPAHLVQLEPGQCGPMLLAFAAQVLGDLDATFETLLQDAIAYCRFVPRHTAVLYGSGALSEAQTSTLRQLLVDRGVTVDHVSERIQGAVQKIGAGPLSKALAADNPWQALKALGSCPSSLFRWIRPEELRAHAQAKAQLQFGAAIGNAKARKQKPARTSKPVLNVDPTALQIAPGAFVSSDGTSLSQLAFDEVGPQARGVAFCTGQQMLPFLSDYRALSVDALALISTAPVPTEVCAGAPASSIRFPAVYAPTQEAVLLSGTILQLGDEHVQLSAADADMGDIEKLDTITGRISFFKDEAQLGWEVFAKAPVKSLLQHIPGLNLCRDANCKGDCPAFHPAVEEHVERLLLDVWARQFAKAEGGSASPEAAELFQALVRVPASAAKHLQHVHVAGFYFEPRAANGFGPHPSYAVVWLPGHDKAQATHLLRTCDKALGLARLGNKFGIRVLDEHEQLVFEKLRPRQPFVKVKVLSRWRLHPLPHGTQRHTLVQLLGKWKWAAKPLQPCKGDSSGCAWEVGSAEDPPSSVLQAGEAFVLIHKLRDLSSPAKPEALCASNRTRRRILYDDPEVPQSSADPWAGGRDPWSLSRPPPGLPAPAASSQQCPAPPSAAVSKLTEVKSELQANLATLVRKEVQAATSSVKAADPNDARIQQLEVGLNEVRMQNSKFEEWFQTFGTQMRQQATQVVEVQKAVSAQQSEFSALKSDVTTSIAQAMNSLQSDMQKQFASQTASLEAMLAKKPRTEMRVPGGTGPLRLLRFLLLLCLAGPVVGERGPEPFCRYGEASNPGPDNIISFGTSNPSGLRNKEQLVADFGPGVWQYSETQLSAVSLPSASRAIRALTRAQHRDVRIFAGAPAPLRPGSSYAGSWTGVLTLSDFPCRPVQLQWLHDSFHSGRIQALHHFVNDTPILTANLYGFPSGKTYTDARARTERLLETLTHELVLGRKGIRMIAGDFNHWHEHLHQVAIWKQQGWIEAQDLAAIRWQTPLVPTCKGSTHRDFIFLSPEAAALCESVRVQETFAEHATVIAGIRLTGVHRVQSWPLPAEIPWSSVDLPAWTRECDVIPIAESCSTRWLRSFARGFEASLVGHVVGAPSGCLPHRCHGRACRLSPDRPPRIHPPKPARPGEEAAHHDLLSLEVKRWYQQLRRLQSLDHAMRAGNQSPSAIEHRLGLWRSILSARGFRPAFQLWWPTRPVQLAGSPAAFPAFLPSAELCSLLFLDFRDNFRKFEAWNIRQRHAILAEQYAHNHNLLFRDLRDPKPEQVDTLELKRSYQILDVDPPTCGVHLADRIDDRGCSQWTLDGCAVQVTSVDGDLCCIPSCPSLHPDAELEQTVVLSSASHIQFEFEKLWISFWQRFAHSSEADWSRVTSFAQAYLPQGQLDLPPISLDQWRGALRRFKPRAARGCDGFAKLDLLNMSDPHALQLLAFLADIEAGVREWPAQWLNGLVCCLKKPNEQQGPEGFRPITLLCCAYRAWSGLRARQVLRWLVDFMPHSALGFMPHREASQFWWMLEAQVELACQNELPFLGYATDVIKAFNALPRQPVFAIAAWIGLPPNLLRPWGSFLDKLERRFLIRNAVGEPQLSTCGFPEGCALSTVAMSIVCLCFHQYLESFTAACSPHSYVDNLACSAQSVGQLATGTAASLAFLDMWGLTADPSKTYVWAVQPGHRSQLKAMGFRVQTHARELGGLLSFERSKHNAALVKRCQDLGPWFDRLRRSPSAYVHKLRALPIKFWSHALHGISGCPLADSVIAGLRAQAVRALGANSAGSSSMLRLSTCGFLDADPGFYQLWCTLRDLRRLAVKDSRVLPLWTVFAANFQGQLLHGPFSKLFQVLGQIGWRIDHPPFVTDHDGLVHNVLEIPTSLLRQLCEQAWLNYVATQHRHRHTMLDLLGIDNALLQEDSGRLNALDSARLAALRSGAFMFGASQMRFDRAQDGLCPFARSWMIMNTASATVLDSLQRAYLFNGLLLWSTPPVRNISSPTARALLACGPVPGLQQSSPRAELWGAIAALKWGAFVIVPVVLWTDSDYVGRGIRRMLRGDFFTPAENADLWELLREQDWAIQWNAHADTAAGVANLNRPLELTNAHARALGWHEQTLEVIRALRGIYFGIAAATQRSGFAFGGEAELEEPRSPDLPPPASAQADFLDELPLNWKQRAADACPELPATFLLSWCSFLADEADSGDLWRQISWLEAVFIFHVLGGQRFPVRSLSGEGWRNAADVPLHCPTLTVAVQFSLTRRALKGIFKALQREDLLVDCIDLVDFGISFAIGGFLFPVRSTFLLAARSRLSEFCAGRKICTVGDLARIF